MGRHRNVNNPRTISIIVDGDVYDKFVQQLPRKTGTSEAIRDIINSIVEEEQKNQEALTNPLGLPQGARAINYINNKHKNLSLDIFSIPTRDLTKELTNIGDINIIRQLKNKGHVIESVCNTRIRKLLN